MGGNNVARDDSFDSQYTYIILFSPEEPDVTAPPTQVMSQAVAVPEPPKVEATTKPETTKPVIAINKPVEQPVSANLFAAGARANGANVMTGRPTSRVLAPPGGHCQITLG
jgi:hypothetical protein